MLFFDMRKCACEHAYMSEANHPAPTGPLSQSTAQEVARLRDGPCTVGVLSGAVQMEQPAVSHQLRVLRDLGLVTGRRQGRHVNYELFDSHVARLLAEALSHIDHVETASSSGAPTPLPLPQEKEAIT